MKYNKNNTVFVLDHDGTITDGKMYYNKDGKYLKAYGSDDADLLKELNKFIRINFITADKKGFPITQKRIEEEMGFELDLVSHSPKERWEFIQKKYKDKGYYVCFMGDGFGDILCLKNSDYGITTEDALEQTKVEANYVSRRGGDRAVASACLRIFEMLELDWRWI